jgi:hypothetical protein
VDLTASIANPESAGRGSIDEVRQSFLQVSSGFKMERIGSGSRYGLLTLAASAQMVGSEKGKKTSGHSTDTKSGEKESG